jgi:hypothetical protein
LFWFIGFTTSFILVTVVAISFILLLYRSKAKNV